MVTKRTFMQLGAAAAGVAVTPLLRAAPTAALDRSQPATDGSLQPEIIFDQRFANSRAVGTAAAAAGACTHTVSGQIEQLWALWYGHGFSRARASRSLVLGGITDHATLFALQLMAQDERMRPIYRAHHRLHADGHDHDRFGSHQVLRRTEGFDISASIWPIQVAHLLLHWPVEQTGSSAAESSIGLAHTAPFGAGTLISWLIAPVAQA